MIKVINVLFGSMFLIALVIVLLTDLIKKQNNKKL
jgi:hypothetical protein